MKKYETKYGNVVEFFIELEYEEDRIVVKNEEGRYELRWLDELTEIEQKPNEEVIKWIKILAELYPFTLFKYGVKVNDNTAYIIFDDFEIGGFEASLFATIYMRSECDILFGRKDAEWNNNLEFIFEWEEGSK